MNLIGSNPKVIIVSEKHGLTARTDLNWSARFVILILLFLVGCKGAATSTASTPTTPTSVGNPDPSFALSSPTNFPLPINPSTPNCIKPADLNGDGRLDLVVTSQVTSFVAVLIGNGDGTFEPAVVYSLYLNPGNTFGPQCVAVADFNNDGRPDLAVVSQTFGSGKGILSILINRGDGTFLPAVNTSAGVNSISIAVGNFNKDGNEDLWIGGDGDGNSAVLLGNGNGTFQAPIVYLRGTSGGNQGTAIGDFNGDGFLDLLELEQAQDSIALLLGRGDGTFGTPTTSAVFAVPQNLLVADFNHDGKPDVATSTASGFGVNLGNGDGTFKGQAFNSPGSLGSYVPVAVGDLDGTGHLDVILGNNNQAAVDVFFGLGDGSFIFDGSFPTGGPPISIAVGDFNGDGVPDLAVALGPEQGISILLSKR